MESLFWLLLPVAAYSGWLASQRHYANKIADSSSNAHIDTSRYYRGVNFLLNDQPDQALSVFIEMLEVNSETVELHLALGHLFRQQGEVDRSIRLHQNLLARPNLDSHLRAQVRLELGKDYLKAGLLDRAEQVLNEFRQDKQFNREALQLLRDLYEQERDWVSAINIGKQLQKKTDVRLNIPLAHYHCELAEDACFEQSWDEAHTQARHALDMDKKSVRANLILARLAVQDDQYQKAIAFLLKVPKQDERFTSEIMLPLTECYSRFEQQKNVTTTSPGSLKRIVRRVKKPFSGAGAISVNDASRLKKDVLELDENITLAGINQYLKVLEQSEQGENALFVSRISGLLERAAEHLGSYRCEQCGFGGKLLHWQCPSCREWQSIVPI